MGSALSSFWVRGLIWIQHTHVEHCPPAISCRGSYQKPARSVAAPSHWSPVMGAHVLQLWHRGVAPKVRQQPSLLMLGDESLGDCSTTLHVSNLDPTTPLIIPLPMALAMTWFPFPWLCLDVWKHPSPYKQAPKGLSPPHCPRDAPLTITRQLMLQHILKRQKNSTAPLLLNAEIHLQSTEINY